jgi:transcription initiation factor TFIIIB Brf1 subunit/transcription initiation factor TFIIB
MITCRICGEVKPVGKKERDRRNYWCARCGTMYQEMKNAKRAKDWEEANRLAIERLKLDTPASFVVNFK